MYLKRKRAKGRTYLYVKKYQANATNYSNEVIVYSFGRIENALGRLLNWQDDFNSLPEELKQEGCTIEDIKAWIRTLETGVHKSGRKFVLN